MQEVEFQIFHVGHRPAPTPWRISDHMGFQRLHYIYSGRGWFLDKNGIRTQLMPGYLYLYPATVQQRFESDPSDPIDHLYVDFFSYPMIAGNVPLSCKIEPESPEGLLLRTIDAVFSTIPADRLYQASLMHLPRNPVPQSDEEKYQTITRLFSCLFPLLNGKMPILFLSDAAVLSALEEIHRHYGEKLTVTDLARRSGYVPDHFSRRFCAAVGKTPHAYLRDYRLMIAKELLHSGVPPAKAAAEVGYADTWSLIRALNDYERTAQL